MNTNTDGGPIASTMTLGDRGEMVPVGGISLRDYFAAMAINGCFSAPCPPAWRAGSHEHREQSVAAAYAIADAMLARRKEEP